MSKLKLYLLTLTIFLALDFTWLGLIARSLYASQLGYLMTNEVNWAAALIFYALFVAGLLEFVVLPALHKKSWLWAVTRGGFFGLVSYATYDLTNLATIKDWPVLVTVVDLAWGALLGGLTCALAVLVVLKRTKRF